MNDSGEKFPCPRCRQSRQALEAVCLGCAWKPFPARQEPEPDVLVTPEKIVQQAGPISIASLMLLTSAAALGAAVIGVHPYVGGVVSLGIAVSLLRVVHTNLRAKVRGGSLSSMQKVQCFLASFILVVLIPMASFIAFCTVCVSAAIVGIGSGALWLAAMVAVLVASLLFYRLWTAADYPTHK